MKKSILFLTLLFLALGIQACPKKETKEEAAAPSAAGEIGVAECDEYLTKIQKCVDEHVPDSAKAMMKQGFDQNIAAWKQAAATPEGKTGLSMACKMAMDSAKQSMGSFGCTF